LTHHLISPLLIPLFTGILCLLAGDRRWLARSIALLGSTVGLGYAGFLLWTVWSQGLQVTALGSWPPPYGIVLIADLFSALMLAISALMGWVVLWFTFATLDPIRERVGFYALYQLLMVGVNGAFLAGDVFNLYVWFEVMLIASFGLMTLGGERGQLEGGLKYVVINLVSSTILIIAIGLLYGTFGTLNLADLVRLMSETQPPALLPALAMLFLTTFGIKAAVFPLFFWLPASYHTPPVAVTALFGGLLTKVGVYALYRVFTLLFVNQPVYIHDMLLLVAGLTMSVGVLGAIAQNNVRRILSFHIISQIGYMIMGLGLFTVAGLAGGVFYVVHHIIVKTALLIIGGGVEHLNGTGQLYELGGQLRQRPVLAMLFLLAALSLAGVPPLSGFFSKLALLTAAVAGRQYAIAIISLLVSLLTLYSMTKIWNEVFWKAAPGSGAVPMPVGSEWGIVLPATILVTLSVLLGLAAGYGLDLSTTAATQLLDANTYVTAVPLP
jgi:multicomponent Na+:H+ antiporter subunit D